MLPAPVTKVRQSAECPATGLYARTGSSEAKFECDSIACGTIKRNGSLERTSWIELSAAPGSMRTDGCWRTGAATIVDCGSISSPPKDDPTTTTVSGLP